MILVVISIIVVILCFVIQILLITPKTNAEVQPPASKTEDAKSPDEYQSILKELRKLNKKILDEDVSLKITKIEQITADIFEIVKKTPEKKAKISTFMNYYLPTTLKLLNVYAQSQDCVAGENLTSVKKDIEGSLDKLVTGFEKQLDALFSADVIDISSDIKVLETMMTQDGLLNNSFSSVSSGGK